MLLFPLWWLSFYSLNQKVERWSGGSVYSIQSIEPSTSTTTGKTFTFRYIFHIKSLLDSSDLTQKQEKKNIPTNILFHPKIQRILQASHTPGYKISSNPWRWNEIFALVYGKSCTYAWLPKLNHSQVYTTCWWFFCTSYPLPKLEEWVCCWCSVSGRYMGKSKLSTTSSIPFLQERKIFFFCFLFIGYIVSSLIWLYVEDIHYTDPGLVWQCRLVCLYPRSPLYPGGMKRFGRFREKKDFIAFVNQIE